MNPGTFRRIVGRLLSGSLPLAALLSSHLGCLKCYPAGTSRDIQYFQLPSLTVDTTGDGGASCSSGPMMVDGGVTDGGFTDGGMSNGCEPMDDVPARCLVLCQAEATRQKRTLYGATPSMNNYPGEPACDCDFGLVHHDAYCLPPGAVEGRRPAGFAPSRCAAPSALVQFFARAAQYEAASVAAFLIVAQELSAHGAPAPLVEAARRAAAQERRHARLTAALVARFGGRAEWPTVPPREVRSLLEVALDNEIEGCVGEAYAAFVAAWQSRAAADPWVRATMSAIAPDEAEHAELSFAISAWLRTRLGRREQGRLDEARHTALSQLRSTVQTEPLPALNFFAGVPTAATAQGFLTAAAH